MKLKPLTIFFYTTILLLCTTCRKETALDKLPPATQEGRNTFGCLVNGKAWMPDNGCDWLCPADLKFMYDFENGGTFRVQADLTAGSQNQQIFFRFYPCISVGKKYLRTGDVTFSVTYKDKNKDTNCQDYPTQQNTTTIDGFVDITRFDLGNGIISGTFEFTLNKPGCETINITNGRFDGKL